jgi:hypothetical protein
MQRGQHCDHEMSRIGLEESTQVRACVAAPEAIRAE